MMEGGRRHDDHVVAVVLQKEKGFFMSDEHCRPTVRCYFREVSRDLRFAISLHGNLRIEACSRCDWIFNSHMPSAVVDSTDSVSPARESRRFAV